MHVFLGDLLKAGSKATGGTATLPFVATPLLLLLLLQACEKYKITPGVFCIGEARAAELAAKGFKYVAYDTDLGAMMAYTSGVQARLKPAAAAKEHVH
jgi:hypothetical protein